MKVIIFNWKGFPNKETMLQALELMAHASDKFTKEGSNMRKFGHLVILLRDLDGEERRRDAEKLLLELEIPNANASFSETMGLDSRNRIRTHLQKCFLSLTVKSLPIPHPDVCCECSRGLMLVPIRVRAISVFCRASCTYKSHVLLSSRRIRSDNQQQAMQSAFVTQNRR